MPVFTFEKISPPIRVPTSPAPAAEKPRSAIVQLLDRFVEARVKRTLIADKPSRPPRKPTK